MSRDYASYNQTPEEQKKIGSDTEWAVVHLLQEYDWIADRFDRFGRGDEGVPRVWTDKRGYIDYPDIFAFRDGQAMLLEVKRKSPTAYGSFGISSRQIAHMKLLAKEMNAVPLFVVWDNDTDDLLYYEISDVYCGTPEDKPLIHYTSGPPAYTFIHRSEFTDFREFLEQDYAEHQIGKILERQQARRDHAPDACDRCFPLPRPMRDEIAELDEDLRELALEHLPAALSWRETATA